jgi:hypothetical protein
VRVLDSLADLNEEFQALAGGVSTRIAVLVNRRPVDQFHHEIGVPGFRAPAVQHVGDTGMIHQCQSLPLSFETSDNLPCVHTGLDNLQRDFAFDGLLLDRHVDYAHATFADLMDELVAPNLSTRALGNRGHIDRRRNADGRRLQEVRRVIMCLQKRYDTIVYCTAINTDLVEIGIASFFRVNATSHFEDGLGVKVLANH